MAHIHIILVCFAFSRRLSKVAQVFQKHILKSFALLSVAHNGSTKTDMSTHRL